MTLDCTNLEPGDRVRLRNGDIETVQRNDHDTVPIKLEGRKGCHFPGGRWFGGKVNDFDIVEILAKTETTHGVNQLMDTTTFPFSWRYRLGTLELSDLTFRNLAKITVNGEEYTPAKPRPIDKKTLTLRDLREAMRAGESPDHDTLQSAIELLEAMP